MSLGGRDADEVLGVVDAARSLVARDLWIRAERTAAIDLAGGRVRRQDRGGRLALLAPLLERRQRVEDVGALAAAAVSHARRVEQPHARSSGSWRPRTACAPPPPAA